MRPARVVLWDAVTLGVVVSKQQLNTTTTFSGHGENTRNIA